MKNKVIKLTEQDLHNIITESVNKIISENAYSEVGVWDALDRLKEFMDDETITVRIISRMAPYEALRILNDIISVEAPDNEEEEEVEDVEEPTE